MQNQIAANLSFLNNQGSILIENEKIHERHSHTIIRLILSDDCERTRQILFFFQGGKPYPCGYSRIVNHIYLHLDSLKEHEYAFPLPGGKVISAYGTRGGHSGADIKTCANDTIRAAFDGVVRMSKPYYAYGNLVVIRHANGLETIYSHNCKNLVRSGDVVKAGQPIGLTGRTGRATTEHVHFETRINGQHFNPNLIFDLKERKLRKECIKCSKNGSGIIVKSQAGNNRIAQNKK